MTSNLFGQYELILATEGTALPSDTEVATFTDGTANDTAANFTATINWGDGVTTVGTVVGSNGSFTVESGHTYSEAGSLNAVITVTRNTDGAQIVLPGVVYVDDVNNLSGNSAGTIVGAPNQALSNVVVATFNDSYTGQGTNGFTVNIDWGDGTTTAGTLSLGGNQIYTVTGSHTYATAGEFTITTFMNDNVPDSTVGFATTTADIGFGGNVVITSATETVAIPSGTAVATFADSSNDPASDYTATIIWGDGNTQVGSVSGSAGSYTVTSTANETYAVEGNYTLTVDITNTADSASTTLAGTVGVAGDASLSASAITVTGNPNVALTNVAVATFSDGNTANTAGEFTALINWGDGTTSTGTVAGSGGSFTVIGSHTYAQNGDNPITVGMAENSDGGLGTDYATVQSTALIGLASISGASITTTEGTPVAAGTQVGVFSDSNLSDTAASFTATINWGDGTSS
ncbi:MAG TPA: hypothetical protein VEK73_15775, partial [Xanthobacteraceae bacterium]|nr:hypothetical protein [Xanthobacteraceae bacterium]